MPGRRACLHATRDPSVWNARGMTATSAAAHEGDVIELDVTSVAHGGVFVARVGADAAGGGGRVVFVPDAIPGERVRVRLTDLGKASFWRGETLEVLDASPHRRPHVWRQADVDIAPEQRPGGADFGHILLEHQRALKLQVLEDALRRIGGLDLAATMEPALPTVGAGGAVSEAESDDGTRWRTRLSLHVDADGRVGPYAARSHRVIPVDDHPLATAAVEKAALQHRTGLPGRVDLVEPSDGVVRVIARPHPARPPRGRTGRRPPNPARSPAARDVVIEKVDGREFHVDAGGFWQVHRLAAATLTRVVKDALRAVEPEGSAIDADAWHLDLYGGVGLFAAALGELGGPSTKVTSVESDPRATEHAAKNLAEWVGARVETSRVDRYLARVEAESSDSARERLSRGVAVIDPPRAGAGRAVVQSLVRLAPSTVVYVACDPVALARDLAIFRDGGYDVHGGVRGLDLFPNSHHIEAVAVLTRSGR